MTDKELNQEALQVAYDVHLRCNTPESAEEELKLVIRTIKAYLATLPKAEAAQRKSQFRVLSDFCPKCGDCLIHNNTGIECGSALCVYHTGIATPYLRQSGSEEE